MDGERRVRPRRGSEFVEEVKGFFFAELRDMGMEVAQAEKVSDALATVLTREFGGSQPYIPLLSGASREDKWAAALERYDRGRLSVESMARQMGVSHRAAYARVKEYLDKKRSNSPSAPATVVVAPPTGVEPKQEKLHPWRKCQVSPNGMSLADQARRIQRGSGDDADDPDKGDASEPVEGGES